MAERRRPGQDGKLFGFSVMSMGNMASALLAYFRFAQITAVFGANWRTDALAVAMVFPQLIKEVIAHSFGSAFIPIYSRVVEQRGHEQGVRFVSKVLTWISLAGLVFFAMLWLASDTIVKMVSPSGSPELLELASMLLRTVLPIIVLVPFSGILANFIKYEKRFRILPMAGIINLGVSLGMIVAVGDRIGVAIMPVSMIAGSVAELVFLLYQALLSGFRFRPSVAADSYAVQLARMSGPVVLGTVVGFFAPIADKMLASFLPESSVTAIDYANRIKAIVLSVVFGPLLVFADLDFSAEAAKGKLDSLLEALRKSLNTTSLIMYPTAFMLMMLAVPVVSVFFQRGNLTGADARYIGYALAFYAPWLAQFGLGSLVSRAFYALKDSRTPVVIGIFGVITNVLLNVILVGPLGIGGLALATTITSTAKTFYLTWSLSRKLGGLHLKLIAAEQGRLLASNMLGIGACVLMLRLWSFSTETPFLLRSSQLMVYSAAGFGVIAASLHFSGSTAMRRVISEIRSRRGSSS
ncbi:MAG TPA: lipid II flippase MurJ [Deltaproteobacteria bacterium]|nr:lipid II flippase MurJ [Deltaproteobacteria bacterium]